MQILYSRTGFQSLNLGQATKFKFSYSIIDTIMHVCCKSHLEKLMYKIIVDGTATQCFYLRTTEELV